MVSMYVMYMSKTFTFTWYTHTRGAHAEYRMEGDLVGAAGAPAQLGAAVNQLTPFRRRKPATISQTDV
jgi:hypothetical protein